MHIISGKESYFFINNVEYLTICKFCTFVHLLYKGTLLPAFPQPIILLDHSEYMGMKYLELLNVHKSVEVSGRNGNGP